MRAPPTKRSSRSLTKNQAFLTEDWMNPIKFKTVPTAVCLLALKLKRDLIMKRTTDIAWGKQLNSLKSSSSVTKLAVTSRSLTLDRVVCHNPKYVLWLRSILTSQHRRRVALVMENKM